MTKGATRPLAELRDELAEQDAQWERAKASLRASGDVTLRVPNEALEAIDRTCARPIAPPAMPMGGIARRV